MQRVAYIQTCRTFSDAMNNIKFEFRIPEYYDSQIPNFFKMPINKPKPIVNGIEVEWDEYLIDHPNEQPDDTIPQAIYQGEEMNLNASYKTIAELLDVIDSNVYVEIPNFRDLQTILGIMEGYYNEVKRYIDFNPELKLFMDKFNRVYYKLDQAYHEKTNYFRNTAPPELKGPVSLIDILAAMGV